jgi:hypothetical protein
MNMKKNKLLNTTWMLLSAVAFLAQAGEPAFWSSLAGGRPEGLDRQTTPPGVARFVREQQLAGNRFVGAADPDCPVTTRDVMLPLGLYRGPDKAVVVIANRTGETRPAFLDIDWAKLGMEYGHTALYTPDIQDVQEFSVARPGHLLLVPPRQGLALVLDATPWSEKWFEGREQLLEEGFAEFPGKAWTVHVSPEGGALDPSGDGLEIRAHAHTCAFGERKWPPAARAAWVKIDSGSDQGMSWGPGLSLVWANGRFLQVNSRQGGQYSVFENGEERLVGRRGSDVTELWMELRDDTILVRVLDRGSPMPEELARFPRGDYPGAPQRLRVGKLGKSVEPKDNPDPGPEGTCRILGLKILR